MRSRLPRADVWGVSYGYEDALHRWHPTRKSTKSALLDAMGVEPAAPQPTNPVLVLRAGETRRLPQPVEITLEDGSAFRLEDALSSELPVGYHRLRACGGNCETHLIIHPGRCYLPEDLEEWGCALQLYALRSRRSWGVGDFADLRQFARWSARELEANFILLNPLGAPLPVLPQEASPYFPSSRLYLNPLYLQVEEVPGARDAGVRLARLANAGHALNRHRLIERDAVFRLKMRALEAIYARFRGHAGFDRYRAEQGQMLRQFATFCVLAEHHGCGWRKWPDRFRDPRSAAVQGFSERYCRRGRFHEWLQWLLDAQLARAARELPLMLDVPIGVNPDGFDAWLWQDALAFGAAIGAPPDEYNTRGQNWSLPPFIPHRLRASGYGPLRHTLRAMLRHARGLRIDHVMGLFRLFWIPGDASPRDGGYVRYHADELLAVLAIESQRAKAVVVGEDLGTVEPGVRFRLRQRGILSYRLLWFENKPPARYPRQALAAVTTHDLFTIAGLWSGHDLEVQKQLGLEPNAVGTGAILRGLKRRAGLRSKASTREAILGAHGLLGQTPCQLLTATLDDLLAVEERPNMPATTTQWPNWSIALPKPLEQIEKDGFAAKAARLLARGGRQSRARTRPKLGRT